MTVSREEFRLAMLWDGIDGWAPLAWPYGYAAQYFPEMRAEERNALVGDLFRSLLASSLIAVAHEPEAGRPARPLPPKNGSGFIDDASNDPAAVAPTVGYVTTRPGSREWHDADLCQVCDGYVSRLTVDHVDFERGMVGGDVAVCAEHRDVDAWPEGAADAMADAIRGEVNEARNRSIERFN
jgi:hypothetical protein